MNNDNLSPDVLQSGSVVLYASVIAGTTAGGLSDLLQTDGSGALNVAITSGGGSGTQYTEGATDASITGTAMLMEGAGDALVVAQGTVADGLLVNLGGNNDITLATLPDTAAGDLAAINTAVSGTLTISGTVTANLSAVDNAVLDTIASPVATIGTTPLQRVAIFDSSDTQVTSFGGGTQYTEDAAAAANPVGNALILVREDARAGSLTTTDGDNVAARGNNKGELYVKTTDSDALLTTIDADTGTIATNTTTLAGVDFATETTLASIDGKITAVNTGAVVISSSALPSGAATAANQTTIIGHVDGIETLLGTIDADTSTLAATDFMLGTDFSTVLGTSSLILATQADDVVNTSDGLQTSSFGYVFDGTTWDRMRGDSANGLLVNLGVNNDITLATLPDTASSDLATINSNTDSLAVVGGGTEATALRVTLANNSTGVLSVDDNGSSLTVDYATTGSGTATGALRVELPTNGTGVLASIGSITSSIVPGTGATNLGKAEDAPHTSGDVGVMALCVANESNTARAANNDYLPIASDTEGNVRMVGNRDHDAIDAGEPVKIGSKTVAVGATPTAVAAGDRADLISMRNGIPFVMPGHPGTVTKNFQVTDADGAQTNADLLGAIGAGTAVVVTKISVTAANSNTVDVSCRVGFGAASTPAADAAGVVLFHPGIAPGSGVVEGSGSGIIGIGASGEELRVTCDDPVTGSISIIVTYFTVAI